MSDAKRWKAFAILLAHALCLAPLLRLVLAAFGALGMDLGANPVERMLHDTGWWALALLLATLAVTPIRRIFNQGWVHRLRRPLGLYAFFYAALHFAVYATLDRELELGTIGQDIAKRPFILVGALALLLLVPLALTSTKAWMRRLGKRWLQLHCLVFPATALGVVHFYWLVKADLREPLAFAAIFAILAGYRTTLWVRKRYSSRTQILR